MGAAIRYVKYIIATFMLAAGLFGWLIALLELATSTSVFGEIIAMLCGISGTILFVGAATVDAIKQAGKPRDPD